MNSKLGHWAFIVGVLLAVIAGLVPALQTAFITWVLVIIGLAVGVLNISIKEQEKFLVAVIALVLVSSGLNIPALGGIVQNIMANILALSAPAALVVALKAIYELAID